MMLNRSLVRSTLPITALAAALAISACRTEDSESQADTSGMPPIDSTGGMTMGSGMMGGGMTGGGMMDQMQSHLRMMDGAGADSMMAMMPMHRQMVASMIAQMNREMRDMQMQMDTGWTATVDSLRQDLVRLPELGAGELQSFMPAHRARVQRIMEMHRRMMADMAR